MKLKKAVKINSRTVMLNLIMIKMMNNFCGKLCLALAISGFFCLTGCSSSTVIQSIPKGAKIYVNNEPVGRTPYMYKSKNIVGQYTRVRLEINGYETLRVSFARNEEPNIPAICGGIFCVFPYLWAMDYKEVRTYELTPKTYDDDRDSGDSRKNNGDSKSKADKLRELKELLDEGILTREEYEREKEKVLRGH